MTYGWSLVRRTAVIAGAVSSLALLGGCQSDDTAADYNNTSTTRPLTESARTTSGQQTLYYPTGDRSTSVLALERTGGTTVRLNQPFTYQVRVTNLTDQPLDGVTVSETTGGTFQITQATGTQGGSSPRGQQAGGQQTGGQQSGGDTQNFTIGTLGAGESRTIEVTGRATQPGQISSCLAVSYQPTICTVATVINPQLRLTKTGPQQADICAPFKWTYQLTNTGTGPTERITVTEQLPEGLVVAQTRARQVQFDVQPLAQGESQAYSVDLQATRVGSYSSSAQARTEYLEASSESVTTQVVAPQLQVAIRAPEAAYVGQPLNYVVTVQNVGEAPARAATLRLTPAQQGGQNNVPVDPAVLASRELGLIRPGETKTVEVQIPTTAAGDLSLAAIATDPCAGDARVAASTELQTISALLLEVVDSNDPVQLGQTTTYTIAVKNQGSGLDRNIRIVATLPEGMQYVSGEGPTQVQGQPQGQRVTFGALAQLQPNQVATWKLNARANNPGDVRFRVEMTSEALTAPVNEEESTRLFDPAGPARRAAGGNAGNTGGGNAGGANTGTGNTGGGNTGTGNTGPGGSGAGASGNGGATTQPSR